MKETELFAPLVAYFETAGYRVDAEVKHCDIVARKGDELIIVEMKTSLNLTVLIQAVERQRLTNLVYIAVPAKALGRIGRRRTAIIRVFRRLEIGILAIHLTNNLVDCIAEPKPFDLDRSRRNARLNKDALIKELAGRSSNLNIGGSTGTPIHTAYREASYKILAILAEYGPLNCRQIKAFPDIPANSTKILYRNFHTWYTRQADSCYIVSSTGLAELAKVQKKLLD